jgi:hypothetical protein
MRILRDSLAALVAGTLIGGVYLSARAAATEELTTAIAFDECGVASSRSLSPLPLQLNRRTLDGGESGSA